MSVVVLIVGSTGFIGARLAAACTAAGHTVVCASRKGRGPAPPCSRRLRIDFASMPPHEELVERLTGIDVVVNAVGILRESTNQSFEDTHVSGPTVLFSACAAAGVRRVVQISALGAEDGARSRYHTTKHRADLALAALPLDWVIVQPSLVYGAGGTSARLFEILASLPLIPLPGRGDQSVQPVHVQDLVAALLHLIESPASQRRVIPAVGPAPMPLRTFLLELRAALGFPPTRTLRVPRMLVASAASIGEWLPGALLDRETLGMLERGNVGNPAPLESLLGRPALTVARFIGPERRNERSTSASLRWLAPLLRIAVAAMWFIAALVSLGLYPVSDSLALLRSIGIPATLAPWALYSASAIDLVFGLLTLWPRRARWLWNAQIAVVLAYTLIITVCLPALWLEPFGPVAKNLPILALLLALRELEKRE